MTSNYNALTSSNCSAMASVFDVTIKVGCVTCKIIAVGAFSKWVGEALGGAPFKIAGGPQTLKCGLHVNFDSDYGP